MPSDGIAADASIKLDLTNWQNPVLYELFEITMYSYFVDEAGE